MMSEENAAVQQGTPATGPAAANQPPAQPASQAQATPETDWHDRYVGLQQANQRTVEELKKAQALLQQYSQHAGTLEQQLNATQSERSTLSQTLEQSQQQLAQFQAENQFWNIVSTEYPDLVGLASVLQRVPDVDQQRQILQTARDRMGGSVQQQVTQRVAQQFAGVTPAASPPAQQPQNTLPSKEEILRQMESVHPNSPEYRRLWALWEQHPANTPATLNPNFVDPFRSDWDLVRQADEMVVTQDLTQTQGPWAPGGPTTPRS